MKLPRYIPANILVDLLRAKGYTLRAAKREASKAEPSGDITRQETTSP